MTDSNDSLMTGAAGLRTCVSAIGRFSEWTGRCVAWLTLVMALVTCVIVIMRYGFGVGSIALQESVIYMHSAVFLLGAAFTLKNEGHVRVDIFYRRFTPLTKAWVDSIGTVVFLLPLCCFLIGVSWHYVLTSWRIGEVSGDPGGLPLVFVLKTLIPVAALSIALQGIAELLRNLLSLIAASPGQSSSSTTHVD